VSVLIRPTTRDDAEALREVRLLALSDEPDAFGSTYAESITRPLSHWAEVAGSWNYYLAFDGDRAVGMASGGRFDPFPQARWLYGMYVRPENRGAGVAVDLVRAVATWAREQPVVTLGLHVTTSVLRARAFYEKLGFAPHGAPEPMERDPKLMLQTMLTDVTTNDRI
jgi:GNAT superfamily N-acetyltransferase